LNDSSSSEEHHHDDGLDYDQEDEGDDQLEEDDVEEDIDDDDDMIDEDEDDEVMDMIEDDEEEEEEGDGLHFMNVMQNLQNQRRGGAASALDIINMNARGGADPHQQQRHFRGYGLADHHLGRR
jgi:hypothetical protein